MPFQPINYASIPPLGLSALLQGMQAGMTPFRELRQAKADQLANALTQLKLKEMPQELQSQLALRNAQMQSALQSAAQKKMLTDMLRDRLSGVSSGQATGQATDMTSSGGDMSTTTTQGDTSSMQGSPIAGASPNDLKEVLFRKLTGLPIELPSEREQRELDLYNRKKLLDQKLTGGETTRFKTTKQVSAQGIQNTLPMLNEIINMDVPSQAGGQFLSPNQQALYQSRVGGTTDSLMAALALPQSDTSLKTAKLMVARAPFESLDDYRRRLVYVGLDLMDRYKKNTGKDLDFKFNTNVKIPIISPDGVTHMIPANKVVEAIRAGGRRG